MLNPLNSEYQASPPAPVFEPMKTHISFLICDMETEQQVYINGLPIGVLKDGVFTQTERIHNDTSIPLGVEQRLVGSRFKDREAFKEMLTAVVNAI
jgi:hypothetical protein